jgi:hypothetical protein
MGRIVTTEFLVVSVGLQTGTGFIGPDRAGPGPGPTDGPEDRDFFLSKIRIKKKS